MTHNQLQAICYKEACQLYHPFVIRRLISIPNDMHVGNLVRWKQYEAIGVTPGVWDMQFNWFDYFFTDTDYDQLSPKITAVTHWFEFKVGADVLSPAQLKFRKTMLPLGHKFYVISDKETFLQHIRTIVEPTLHIAKQIWQEEVEYTKKQM